MDFEKIAEKAEQVIQQRGGMESVEEDGKEVLGIVQGDGSLADKAKGIAAAIKEPGAPSQS